jgi:CubicO group peptidase (beta-lactamase class C family)
MIDRQSSSFLCSCRALVHAGNSPRERVMAARRRRSAPIDAFVKAFNSGSAEQFEAMAKEHYTPAFFARRPASARAAAYQEMFAEFGRITADRVTRNGPGGPLNLHVKGATGVTAVVGLELEASSPFRISNITVEVGGSGDPDLPATGAPPPITARMSKEEISRALDGYLSKMADSDTLSGVVLVAKGGKPVFEKAYGFADRSNKVPNTTATRFSLGSINKSFTQTAIAQLVAAGKLSYSDTLGKLIPDYPQEQTRAATVEQLLQHTAGIADFFGDDFAREPKDRFRSNADYYRFVSSKPPLFAPGTRNQYCNGCYITLGAIIERVSGVPYERYIAEHVFKPAGMSAGFPQADAIEPNIALGYTRRASDGQIRNSIFMRGAAGSAAGSAYATAADLLAFDNALRELRLLDPKGTARMLRSAETGTGRIMGGYGIAGGASGTNAILESDGVWTVVVLTNFDPPTGENLGVAIQRVLSVK